jgi:hypothetical protein
MAKPPAFRHNKGWPRRGFRERRPLTRCFRRLAETLCRRRCLVMRPGESRRRLAGETPARVARRSRSRRHFLTSMRRLSLLFRSGTFSPKRLLILYMRTKFFVSSTMAGLTALIANGCVEEHPVYTAPPPVAGTYAPAPTPAPGPAPAPAPSAAPVEPPPGTAVTASVPPPAPPVDVAVTPAPGPDYVWTAGYWNWNGVAWVWVPGVWVHPPFRGAVWFGGHWAFRGGRHVWVRGRWR